MSIKPRSDLVGLRVGKLTVVRFCGRVVDGERNYHYRYRWLCRCDCGAEKEVATQHLRRGAVTSCGCSKLTKDGVTAHPMYQVWVNMFRRCNDPRDPSFPDYGGRGIRVCERWHDPATFISDMGNRPAGATIERVDNGGPYSPENCVWADRVTQASNKRNVPTVEFLGECLSVAQWARKLGIPAETLRSRLKSGRTMQEAVSMRGQALIDYMGESLLVTQWAKRFGIPTNTLRARLKAGKSMQEATRSPPKR